MPFFVTQIMWLGVHMICVAKNGICFFVGRLTKSVNVVVQQHSRKLLKMGILMPETCLVSKKKNKNSK